MEAWQNAASQHRPGSYSRRAHMHTEDRVGFELYWQIDRRPIAKLPGQDRPMFTSLGEIMLGEAIDATLNGILWCLGWLLAPVVAVINLFFPLEKHE